MDGERELVCRLVIDGEPVSKERPRTVRGHHTYTPKRTVDAEKAINSQFRLAAPHWRPDAIAPFEVEVDFWCNGRKDLDNMVKTVLDALNRAVWRDDVQVCTIHARAHRNVSTSRTEVRVYRLHIPPPQHIRDCARCGTPFALPKPTSTAQYCSTGCRRG